MNTLHREVERLVAAGLIASRPVGRSRLLSANPGNRATGPLTELLQVTFGPRPVVEEEFGDLPGAIEVLIFGSWAARYAGHEGGAPNDLDVLVIGSPSRADVYDAADRAQVRLGMQVNPVIRTPEQWQQGDDPLVGQIKASAFVQVWPAVGEAR